MLNWARQIARCSNINDMKTLRQWWASQGVKSHGKELAWAKVNALDIAIKEMEEDLKEV